MKQQTRTPIVAMLMAALVAVMSLPVSADSVATIKPDPLLPEPWFQVPDPLVVAGSGFREHLALVTIPSQGSPPIVNLPVPETLVFNLAIRLPYQNGSTPGNDPVVIVSTVNEIGETRHYVGYVNRHEDPSGNATESTVELFFSNVDYVRMGSYNLTMSWEPGLVYGFRPTNLLGFQMEVNEYGVVAYELADDAVCDSPWGCPEIGQAQSSSSTKAGSAGSGTGGGSGNGGSGSGGSGSGGSGSCTGRTYVGYSVQNTAGFADSNSNQGNVAKTYASADFDAPTTWYGGCNKSGPSSYWAGNGYGATIRGPNSPPKGLPFVIEWSTAYKGGGSGYGSSDGFGWKEITAKPQITFQKPSQNNVRLEATSVLGLNKNSCTTWPQPAKEALDVLSLFVKNSYANVVLYFATRDYCSNDKPWTSLDSGTTNDRSMLGARIDKGSQNSQYEYGGRFAVYAAR